MLSHLGRPGGNAWEVAPTRASSLWALRAPAVSAIAADSARWHVARLPDDVPARADSDPYGQLPQDRSVAAAARGEVTATPGRIEDMGVDDLLMEEWKRS